MKGNFNSDSNNIMSLNHSMIVLYVNMYIRISCIYPSIIHRKYLAVEILADHAGESYWRGQIW